MNENQRGRQPRPLYQRSRVGKAFAAVLLGAAAPHGAAHAQAANTVTVTGSAEKGAVPVAGRTVVPRAELLKFGDSNLADALARIPGVTVSGSGATREIRLRGLGDGYTQILVNGNPVARGFSIESLAPDLVEQVEVLRSSTAESGAQAIAGSINIVLRSRVQAPERSVRLTAGVSDGLGSGSAAFNVANRSDSRSVLLSGSLSHDRTALSPVAELVARDGAGETLFSRSTLMNGDGTVQTAALTPRVVWTLTPARSLALDGLLQGQRFLSEGLERRTVLAGDPPTFAANTTRIDTRVRLLRASLHWKDTAAPWGQTDLKLTGSSSRRTSDGWLLGDDDEGVTLLRRDVDATLDDHSLAAVGKMTVLLGDRHAAALGVDGQIGRRAERRIQRESSDTGFAVQNLDEDYEADIARIALYLQDEWSAGRGLLLYAGVRWEGVHTAVASPLSDDVRRRHAVLSPTVQMVWKVPDTKSDQVRLAIGRTYRAPSAQDLVPRRLVANDNSATMPDQQGNPELRPEVAWGLDATYETQWPNGTVMSLGVYARSIDDVIVSAVAQDEAGRWFSTPRNIANAKVLGGELDLRTKLRGWDATLPDVDLRLTLALNRSRVDVVPGPGNRLARQPSAAWSLGLNHRLTAPSALSYGANLALEPRDFTRLNANQSERSPGKRLLDAFALWQFNTRTGLRASVVNLARPTTVADAGYEAPGFRQDQRTRTPTARTLRLTLEHRL